MHFLGPGPGLHEAAARCAEQQEKQAAAVGKRHVIFSSLVDAEWNHTQKTAAGFYTDPARTVQRAAAAARRAKMSTVPHQHNFTDTNAALAIISMHLTKRPANILPTESRKGRNLVSPRHRCL